MVAGPADREALQLLFQLVTALATENGSDLHLRINLVPHLRVHGELVRFGGYQSVVRSSTMEEIAKLLLRMGSGGFEKMKWEVFQRLVTEQNRVNFSACTKRFTESVDGQQFPPVRMRVQCFQERGGIALVVRILNDRIPPLSSLGFEEYVLERIRHMVERACGLVLVTGPTGSGKTTTLGAIINEINTTRAEHIVTIEDPTELEYGEYSPLVPNSDQYKSLVTYREVPVHCASFREGLEDALREDPNIILVGEMRSMDTIEAALTAAETGHLVFSTLHTNGGYQTISRIVGEFSSDRRPFICEQLARNLNCVISQRLLRRNDNTGRVLCYEYLEVKGPVRAALVQNKLTEIPNSLNKDNAVKFNDTLRALESRGAISKATMEHHLMREED